MSEATKRPWLTKESQIYAENGNGQTIAVVYDLKDDADGSEEAANAALIVQAVNSHDALTVELRSAIARIDHGAHLGEIRDHLMQMLKIADPAAF